MAFAVITVNAFMQRQFPDFMHHQKQAYKLDPLQAIGLHLCELDE